MKNKDFDEWIVFRESVRVKHAAIHGNGTGSCVCHTIISMTMESRSRLCKLTLFGKMPALNHSVTKDKLDTLGRKNVGPPINSRESPPIGSFLMRIRYSQKRSSIAYIMMGTELVGPLGNLSVDEMGPHPELTEQLIAVMKDCRYDLRRFLSVLFKSKTYQSKAIALDPKDSGYVLDGPVVRRISAEAIVDSFLSLQTATPDQFVPTEFQWDGFTHFYDKSQSMGVKDFVNYSVKGPGRGAFQRREENAARRRNGRRPQTLVAGVMLRAC